MTHIVTLHAGPARRRPTSGRRHAPAARPTPNAGERRGSPSAPLAAFTLLVVEDHEDSREFLRRLLRALGARVLVAANGLDALNVLQSRRPDAILLDLMMPIMDGFTFARRLSRDRRWSAIPVIAVTALGGARDLLQTWQAGFAGHLTKPVGHFDLLTVVKRALGPPTAARKRSPRR
jgi:two-component system capsular synthesis sensor histidine kinase RcsC